MPTSWPNAAAFFRPTILLALALMAGGVLLSGLRDYQSAHRRSEWPTLPGKKGAP